MQQQTSFLEPDTTPQFALGNPDPVAELKLARKSDPESSKQAARSFVYSGELKTHEETIYHLLLRADKLGRRDSTCYELEQDMQSVAESRRLLRHEILKRLRGMEKKGAVQDCGLRYCEVGKKELLAWKAI